MNQTPKMPRSNDMDLTKKVVRRREQLREAQRKYRENRRQREEIIKRDKLNEQNAGSAYMCPKELDGRGELSGLPWGGFRLKYVTDNAVDQNYASSQQESSTDATTGYITASTFSNHGIDHRPSREEDNGDYDSNDKYYESTILARGVNEEKGWFYESGVEEKRTESNQHQS